MSRASIRSPVMESSLPAPGSSTRSGSALLCRGDDYACAVTCGHLRRGHVTFAVSYALVRRLHFLLGDRRAWRNGGGGDGDGDGAYARTVLCPRPYLCVGDGLLSCSLQVPSRSLQASCLGTYAGVAQLPQILRNNQKKNNSASTGLYGRLEGLAFFLPRAAFSPRHQQKLGAHPRNCACVSRCHFTSTEVDC